MNDLGENFGENNGYILKILSELTFETYILIYVLILGFAISFFYKDYQNEKKLLFLFTSLNKKEQNQILNKKKQSQRKILYFFTFCIILVFTFIIVREVLEQGILFFYFATFIIFFAILFIFVLSKLKVDSIGKFVDEILGKSGEKVYKNNDAKKYRKEKVFYEKMPKKNISEKLSEKRKSVFDDYESIFDKFKK